MLIYSLFPSRSGPSKPWRAALILSKFAMVAGMGLALTACGLRRSLQPAPPIFGSARQAYEAQKKAEAEAEAAKAAKARTKTGNAQTQTPSNPTTQSRSSVEIPVSKPQS